MNLLVSRTVLNVGVTAVFLAVPAHAERWWTAPELKARVAFPNAVVGNGPHYWNQDESGTFLFATTGYSRKTIDWGYLYSIDALSAANGQTTNPVPIASGNNVDLAPNSYGLRGGALSDELGLVLSGNAYEGSGAWNSHVSLPTDGTPWTRAVPRTVFDITNNVSVHVVWDSGDFSHDSQYLYTNDYLWDIVPGESERIWKWEVGNLGQDGMGLASNAVYYTQVLGIWSVNVYHIGGRDLVFYGGLDHAKERIIVCVFDTVDETETVLVDLPNDAEHNPFFGAWNDFEVVQNIKVGGVGLGQMHLYVTYDNGTIMIYNLRADGKSVGAKVRHFAPQDVMDILGVASLGACRVLEVTNDERIAFFASHAQQAVHVLHSHPVSGVVILR